MDLDDDSRTDLQALLAAAQRAAAVSSGERDDVVSMFGASLLAGLDPGATPATCAALRELAATARAHRVGHSVLEILGELRRSAARRRRGRPARRARAARSV